MPFCDAEGWGPISSTRTLDFTICFQDSVLLVLPSAIFLIAVLPRFFIVLSKGRLEGVTSTPTFRAKTTGVVAAFALQVALLAIVTQNNSYASSAILSSVLYIVSILAALALHYVEHFNIPNPSGTLLLYWLFTALLSIFPTRSRIQNSPNGLGDPLPLLKLLFTIVAFIVFGLENISKACHHELKRPNMEKVVQANPSPEAHSNFFVRMTFLWLLPLLNKGTKKTLRMDDIWALHPKLLSYPLFLVSQAKIDADEAIARQRAEKLKAEGANDTSSVPSRSINLYSVLMSTVGWSFWSAAIPRLLYIAALYVRPVFFTSLLNFLSSYSAESKAKGIEPAAWKGYGYVIAIFVSAVLSGIFNAQFSNICFQASMKARSALVSLIYRKALRLSSTNKQEGIGAIVNHMSADVDRILLIFTNIYFFGSGIIELAVVAYLLYQQIKYSMIAAIGVVIIITTACGGMAPAIRGSQELIMIQADKRMKLISELVNYIKSTKLYAWERYFIKNITESRYRQLHFVRLYYVWTTVSATLLYSATTIASFAAMSIYATIATPGMPLNITRMFSALTYINMLGTPLLQTKTAIPIIISGKVSYNRVKAFLESEEISPDNVVRNPNASASDVAYEIKDGTFGWYSPETIKNMNERRGNESKEKAEEAAKEFKDNQNKTDYEKTGNGTEAVSDGASQLDADKKTDEETRDTLGPVLHNVSLTVKRGSLTAVVGRVGQGKSSLAGALLGEMYKYSGSVTAYGSLAYVAQSAWILNDTVRNNVLFGHEYDKERYLQVIKACALISDFKMLVNGDQTLIGEKGINLSGGQRQRISIARAVYANADVYIFDDPLSAVDAHVDRHIFEEAISQILADKTRILITNGTHHLQDVDQIIVVKQGKIAQDGSYEEVIQDTEGDLFRLVVESNLTHGGTNVQDDLKDMSGNTSSTENEEEVAEVSSNKEGAHSGGPIKHSTDCEPNSLKHSHDDDFEFNEHQVVEGEVTKEGRVGWEVYKNYMQCAGPFGCAIYLFLNIVFITIQFYFQFWLKQWGNDNQRAAPSHSLNYWILTSLGWTLGSMATLGSIYCASYLTLARRASMVLHAGMLKPLVRSPMSFFDITSSGKIINRFSQDITAVDLNLPMMFVGLLFGILIVLEQFAFAIAATPYCVILLVPLCICYYYLAGYYLVSSRELKRLDSAARSP
ncbi:Multidrug resistance-associated protein 1, partial [Gryganskiella cystojenkinii]